MVYAHTQYVMPHASTLVLCAALIAKAMGFAFVGVAPSVGCSAGLSRWALPRTPASSSAAAASVSQITTMRRVRGRTYYAEPKQQQHRPYHDLLPGRQGGSRVDTARRLSSISATAHGDGDDGGEVVPARCGHLFFLSGSSSSIISSSCVSET